MVLLKRVIAFMNSYVQKIHTCIYPAKNNLRNDNLTEQDNLDKAKFTGFVCTGTVSSSSISPFVMSPSRSICLNLTVRECLDSPVE